MDKFGQPCPGPLPGGTLDPDPEWGEYLAWADREMAAGRDAFCEPWDLREGKALESWLPEGGEPEGPESCGLVGPRFGHGDEADVLPPGPLLVALTEDAVLGLSSLSDRELIGVLQATRRQAAREQYKQVLLTAEFGRRRQAAFEDAAGRGVPVGCRPGGFPGDELAMELVTTRAEAGHRIDDAVDLTTRLPKTLAGMAAGMIDEARAGWIAMYTRSLSPADAARADEILAADAPDLRVEQVARKALALEKKFAPEAVRARKERAKRNEQRVEARLEMSGNASLSGREMDTTDAMASKAYIDAMAARLRMGGLAGPIGTLRVLAMADLTQGRNPLDRLKPPDPVSSQPATPFVGARPSADDVEDFCADTSDDSDDFCDSEPTVGGVGDPRGCPVPGPVPAQINLIVPVGTLLGWSSSPAQAGGWGLLDRDETRAVVGAAAQHPATRLCATLTAADGTAIAHACAHGQHADLLDDLDPQPPSAQSPPTRLVELLRRLDLTFTPIARGTPVTGPTCDHAQAEEHYTPSRKLRHLVRARTATCDAPGCDVQAVNADLDHTVAYPDGPTDQCNLAPRCRTHHRAKQAPDWKVEQPAPGVTRWTLPSGRTRVTTPTRYEA